MKSSRKLRDLAQVAILVFFEKSYVVPHSCKHSQPGLNQFSTYNREIFRSPLDYLMLKKPRLVRAKRFKSLLLSILVLLQSNPVVAVQIFFLGMSSLHFEKFQGISFNRELYQKHTPPPMFMNFFLERMEALSATKALVASTLPKPILNVLPTHVQIHFSEKQLPQIILCCKYDFQIVQKQKFQKFFRKSIIVAKVSGYLPTLVVDTYRYSIKTLF